MSIRRFVLVATAGALLAFPAADAFAAENNSPTRAPLGFQIFCLQHPGECKGSRASSTPHTAELMRKLKQVNLAVNRQIRPRHDAPGRDKWSLGVSSGDCEDYVLAKRSALVRSGIAAGALRIATARTPQGEGHAVLIVKTSKGDLVLDNLTNAIKPKSATGLRFISISGANPLRWAANG